MGFNIWSSVSDVPSIWYTLVTVLPVMLSLEMPLSLSQEDNASEIFLVSDWSDATNLAEEGKSIAATSVFIKHMKQATVVKNVLTIFWVVFVIGFHI